MKLKNRYFLVRHGESIKNVKNIVLCWPEKIYSPLTRKGEEEVEQTRIFLKNKKIDLIFSSDILRAKQTAEIINKNWGLKIELDERLREINLGILNGQSIEEAGKFWAIPGKTLSSLEYFKRRYVIRPPKGETYEELEKRLLDFIKSCEEKYEKKNILVVSHARPLTLLEKVIYDYDIEKFVDILVNKKEIKTGEVKEII